MRLEIPVPFPLGGVNAWAFAGDHPALVDCGLGTPEGRAIVQRGLHDAGIDPAGLTVYVTHGHVDHAGNARWLVDQGAKLVAPREEAPFLETFRRDGPARNDDYADALRLHGMPDEDVRRIRERSDGIDQYTEDCPIADDLPDGARIVLGNAEYTAVRTPGHTPGSTCYLSEDHVMLTGDTLLETITSNAIELRDADRGAHYQYVQTIDGMRRYVGCEALPGHRDPFAITDDVLDYHLTKHERRAKRILGALHRERTAFGLLSDVFPHLGPDAWFLAMADIVGHLHALELEGKVRSRDDGVRRFQAA